MSIEFPDSFYRRVVFDYQSALSGLTMVCVASAGLTQALVGAIRFSIKPEWVQWSKEYGGPGEHKEG